jgi:hypothetical protein
MVRSIPCSGPKSDLPGTRARADRRATPPSRAGRRSPDQNIRHAATHFLIYPLTDSDSGPQRELWLGPDLAGNLLEIVVLLLDDGRSLIIHAMRMRPKYRDLLP